MGRCHDTLWLRCVVFGMEVDRERVESRDACAMSRGDEEVVKEESDNVDLMLKRALALEANENVMGDIMKWDGWQEQCCQEKDMQALPTLFRPKKKNGIELRQIVQATRDP